MCWNITDNMLSSPLYFMKLFLAQAFLNFAFELCEGFFFFSNFVVFFLCGFTFQGWVFVSRIFFVELEYVPPT
jgi:hypothetical protein